MNSPSSNRLERQLITDILQERLAKYLGDDIEVVTLQVAAEVVDELVRHGFIESYDTNTRCW